MRNYKPAVVAFVACFIVNDISGNEVTGFLGHPLVLEFLAGALIAVVPKSRTAALVGLVPAFVIVVLVWGHDMPFGWHYAGSADQLYRIFCWGAPAALIVYAALAFEDSFAASLWEPLVVLGNASYALYLTHSAVVSLNLWPPIGIGLAIAVGIATHLWVEKPLVAAATKCLVPRQVEPIPPRASAAVSA